jgi:ketosteroid isomerase-like protein
MESTEQREIRTLLEERDGALRQKDLRGILVHHAADVVFFDVMPPFQVEGLTAHRRAWEACLPRLPKRFSIETRDLRVAAGGDVAGVHRLVRIPEIFGSRRSWVRETLVCRWIAGRWRIVHEHDSLPVDSRTGEAVLTQDPPLLATAT